MSETHCPSGFLTGVTSLCFFLEFDPGTELFRRLALPADLCEVLLAEDDDRE